MLNINPLIVTLGMAAILRGLGYVVTDARTVFGFPDSFLAIGRTDIGPVPVPVIIGALVFIIGGYMPVQDRGRAPHLRDRRQHHLDEPCRCQDRAPGDEPVHDQRRADRARAVLTIARLGSASPEIGTQFELDVLTAAILGGAAFAGGGGHPLGILFGVVTIGVIDAGIIFAGVPDFWQQIVKGAVLILALATDQYAIRRRAKARPAESVEPVAANSVDACEAATGPALAADVTRGSDRPCLPRPQEVVRRGRRRPRHLVLGRGG